ncbi:MAG: sigma-70 family RNA polymerase sigma factor, partial [Pseudomonadales bacterium]
MAGLCCYTNNETGSGRQPLDFEQRICDQIPHLRRYARALCRDATLADDLVQNCLERALCKRHLWRPSGRIRSWLFRMMYRIYLNDRASAPVRREEITPDAGDSQTEDGSQEMHVEVHQVLHVVDKLPLEQRAALLLMALENPGYREAARILDINVGTLRSR